MFKELKQRGQALVLYAFMIPMMFLAVGAVADLGWYYLNVSRLQNAADAAVLAGAQALVKDDGVFEKYFVVSLANNNLPADFDDYKDVYRNTFDSKTSAAGKLLNYQKENEDKLLVTLNTGRYYAEEYARKNLSDGKEVSVESSNVYIMSATDSWNASPNDSEKKVTGTLGLKYKIIDGKNDVYGPLYYVVNLEEKIRHFLLPNWFDPMNAKVRAVALLRPHYNGMIEPIQDFERIKVIDNWEYANKFKEFSGKWNHYQAGVKGQSNLGIRYESGNAYRNESVIVTPDRKTAGKSITQSSEGSSGEVTDANGGNWYSEDEVDSINIDFRAEVKEKFSSDWDLGYDFPESGHSYQFMNNDSWSATDGADKRILFNTEFDQAFEARTDKIRGQANPDDNRNSDPLWVRIESDPLKNPYNGAGVSNFNSVRQITLNFNSDNTSVTSDSDGSYYQYRPYFIFYDGPENIDKKTDPETDVLVRHSQPVVLNLNEDLNAIIYMPESPVIINGNGNTLHGFVIAKCFLDAVKSEDLTGSSGVTLYDGFNKPKNLAGNFSEGTDGKGNTVYFQSDDLVTRDEIDKLYPDATITTDETSKVLTVKETPQPTKYILLNYTKADSENYEYEVMTNGQHDENKTFAAYINATYKDTFTKFSGLSDSEITAINFPDENFNETTATYYVATADLSETKKDNNYVKVKVMADGEVKYVDQKKLPYVFVRTGTEYFYVCVADLQLLKNSSGNNGNKGVHMVYKKADGNYDYIYKNPTSIDQYGDSWKVNRTDKYDKGYYNAWKTDKVKYGEENGVSYFILEAEITNEPKVVAEYQQIEGDNYIKKGEKLYYTKVNNNANNSDNYSDNYIIVDENGNILTKPVTAPEIAEFADTLVNDKDHNLSVNDVKDMEPTDDTSNPTLSAYYDEYTREPNNPDDLNNSVRDPDKPKEIPGDDGEYIGKSSYRQNEHYRIPALERVYKKSTFDLRDDSCYSFFDIDELWRVNYTYLNVDEINKKVNRVDSDKWKVDDMFFTYKRAAWID